MAGIGGLPIVVPFAAAPYGTPPTMPLIFATCGAKARKRAEMTADIDRISGADRKQTTHISQTGN